MSEHRWPVSFDVLVKPQAGARLGQDGSERGLAHVERVARGPIFAAFAALNYSGLVLVNGGSAWRLD